MIKTLKFTLEDETADTVEKIFQSIQDVHLNSEISDASIAGLDINSDDYMAQVNEKIWLTQHLENLYQKLGEQLVENATFVFDYDTNQFVSI